MSARQLGSVFAAMFLGACNDERVLQPPDLAGARSVLLLLGTEGNAIAADTTDSSKLDVSAGDHQQAHLLAFGESLFSLNLQPGPVNLPSAPNGRELPLVLRQFHVDLRNDAQWEETADLPDALAALRLPDFDPVACQQSGGCLESRGRTLFCRETCDAVEPAPPIDPMPPASITPPAPPIASSELRCPGGWVPDPADVGFCRPLPLPVAIQCADGSIQPFGSATCVALGPPCVQGDRFASDLPVDRPTLYVDPDAPPNGDGTPAQPFHSIEVAQAAAAAGTVLALAGATFSGRVQLDRGVTLWGKCVLETVLTDANTTTTFYVVTSTGTEMTEVRNLRILARTHGILSASPLKLENVWIQGAGSIGWLVLDESTAFNVHVRGFRDGIRVRENQASLTLTTTVLEDNSTTSLLVDQGASADARNLVIRGGSGPALFAADGASLRAENILVDGGASTAVKSLREATTATVTNVHIRDGASVVAFEASQQASLDVYAASVRANGHDVLVDSGARVRVEVASFEGNRDNVVDISGDEASTVILSRVQTVVHSTSQLDVTDGRVRLRDVSLTELSTSGAILHANGTGGIDLERGRFRGAGNAVVLQDTATATITDLEVFRPTGAAGSLFFILDDADFALARVRGEVFDSAVGLLASRGRLALADLDARAAILGNLAILRGAHVRLDRVALRGNAWINLADASLVAADLELLEGNDLTETGVIAIRNATATFDRLHVSGGPASGLRSNESRFVLRDGVFENTASPNLIGSAISARTSTATIERLVLTNCRGYCIRFGEGSRVLLSDLLAQAINEPPAPTPAIALAGDSHFELERVLLNSSGYLSAIEMIGTEVTLRDFTIGATATALVNAASKVELDRGVVLRYDTGILVSGVGAQLIARDLEARGISSQLSTALTVEEGGTATVERFALNDNYVTGVSLTGGTVGLTAGTIRRGPVGILMSSASIPPTISSVRFEDITEVISIRSN